MLVDHQYQHLNIIRHYGNIATQPLYYLSQFPVNTGKFIYEYFRDRDRLLAEKKRLHQKNLELSSQLMQSLVIEKENKILRNILKSTRKEIRHSAIVAELIGIVPSPLEQKVIVNKGTSDGIYINQPALNSDGIIGQVSEVNSFNATVTLISSPGHSLLGEVSRSNMRVLVTGMGNSERLKLPYVPINTDIRVNDKIITSSLESRFPTGYPVAVVTEVTQEPGDMFATIYAAPVSRLGNNQQMLLINIKTQKNNEDDK